MIKFRISIDFEDLTILAISKDGREWQTTFTDGEFCQTLDLTDEELMALIISSNDNVYEGYKHLELLFLIKQKVDKLFPRLNPIP